MKKYLYALIALLFCVQVSFAQNPTLIYSTNGFDIYPVNQHAGKLFLGFDGGNVNDVLTWNGTAWVAAASSSSGSGNVFLASNNVFVASATNTFNGYVVFSNGFKSFISGGEALDTVNRDATASTGFRTIDWQNALLLPTNSVNESVDWQNGFLRVPGLTRTSVNWRDGQLNRVSASALSVDFENGNLYNGLSGGSSAPTLNYFNNNLIGTWNVLGNLTATNINVYGFSTFNGITNNGLFVENGAIQQNTSSATNYMLGSLIVGTNSMPRLSTLHTQSITSNHVAFTFRGATGQVSNLVHGVNGSGTEIFAINSTGSLMSWGIGLGGSASAGTITLNDSGSAVRIQQGSVAANSKIAINAGGSSGAAILFEASGAEVGRWSTNSLTVSNSLLVAKTTTLGTNGSAITFLKTATASLDFPSILAGGSADLTITVGGANTNDVVTMGRPFDEDSGLVTRAFVSVFGTVTVRANNSSAAPIDQGAKTYRVGVTQF